MPSTPSQPRRLSLFRRLCYSTIVVLTFFLVLEGACSVLIVLKHMLFDQPLAERVHTEYDADLGWINKQSFYRADMYGPGIPLRTNSQRSGVPKSNDRMDPWPCR